jgi:transposase-like protein
MSDPDGQALSFEPAPQQRIDQLDTLKVFSDTLRQQIIEAITEEPKTVKQIASMLDLVPTKLYYHVNLLEQHQLIRVVDTRVVSGIIEKRFRASARQYTIAPALLTPGQASPDAGEGDFSAVRAALNAILSPLDSDIRRSARAGALQFGEQVPLERRLRFWRGTSRLTLDDALEFYHRLDALISEFEARNVHDHTAQAYTIVAGIYPTVYFHADDTGGEASAAGETPAGGDTTGDANPTAAP